MTRMVSRIVRIQLSIFNPSLLIVISVHVMSPLLSPPRRNLTTGRDHRPISANGDLIDTEI
jgi:hypothetical protein